MLIIFSIALFILRKFAWKPILNALKDREQSISSALNSAEEAKNEVWTCSMHPQIRMDHNDLASVLGGVALAGISAALFQRDEKEVRSGRQRAREPRGERGRQRERRASRADADRAEEGEARRGRDRQVGRRDRGFVLGPIARDGLGGRRR